MEDIDNDFCRYIHWISKVIKSYGKAVCEKPCEKNENQK